MPEDVFAEIRRLGAILRSLEPGRPPPAAREQRREADRARRFLKRLRARHGRDIPTKLRFAVLERDGYRCVCCGASPRNTPGCKLHIDHVVPFSRGGRSELGNLRTLCADCNMGKGAVLRAEERRER